MAELTQPHPYTRWECTALHQVADVGRADAGVLGVHQ